MPKKTFPVDKNRNPFQKQKNTSETQNKLMKEPNNFRGFTEKSRKMVVYLMF